MFATTGKFVRHVLPGIVRPMRVLWNQLIGFLFLVLAGFMALATWRHLDDPDQNPLMMAAGFAFAAFLAFFGITSFLRARKVSRSWSRR